MIITLTYNYPIEVESQDLKAIEIQENSALEMVTKDHLQLVSTLYVPPALNPFSMADDKLWKQLHVH
jgi:hypothetical protein